MVYQKMCQAYLFKVGLYLLQSCKVISVDDVFLCMFFFPKIFMSGVYYASRLPIRCIKLYCGHIVGIFNSIDILIVRLAQNLSLSVSKSCESHKLPFQVYNVGVKTNQSSAKQRFSSSFKDHMQDPLHCVYYMNLECFTPRVPGVHKVQMCQKYIFSFLWVSLVEFDLCLLIFSYVRFDKIRSQSI